MDRTEVLAEYRVRLASLATKLDARCGTHAYLVEAQDIQDVIHLLAELIGEVDTQLYSLDSMQGRAIAHLQACRRLAVRIRSRCFTMMESFDKSRERAKPPDFYDLLVELPQQLRDLGKRVEYT